MDLSITGKGGGDKMIEFEIKDTGKSFTIDIDCNDGSMELHQINDSSTQQRTQGERL